MDPTSFSDFIASPSSAGGGGGGGSTPSSSSTSATPSSSASTASSSSSSSSKRLTSFNLFAALLNGSLPPPKPLHLLTSSAIDSRALPIVAHPAFNPSALSSSSSTHLPPFARELPSYSYASPVDLDIGRYPTMNPLQSVDWKIRLFQLHKAMHASRFHPTEGYLANPKLEETVAKAQLLILQLLGATSNQKARFDGRRVLSIEDQNYIDFAPMDPRLDWLPDPLVRVHTSRATSRGNVNLTDMTGQGIETAILYGDSWDFGAWAMSDHFHTPYIPYCVVAPLGFKCQGDKGHPPHSPGDGGFGQHVGLLGNHAGLRGSSVRDIVLGLEGPNWRTTEPVFTTVPEGLWEHTRYDASNSLHHEIAWRAGGAAEVHAAIIESWCKGEEGRLMVNEL
ncbi:hypothetical protein BDY24DRAFT_373042, partial [Mrakia frigida]|uniref:uncharacterized protein n=1 Tax=Mrakia frigida TaxID=29902 RepID=UPI003FCBF9C8